MAGRILVPSRQFAAQAAAIAQVQREVLKAEPLKVSSLKNGLSVASSENFSPVATMAVVIKAGSRNETYETSGISHVLRLAAGLGTKNNSAFSICRNLQQAGASLSCTQGREHTVYTVQVTRDQTDMAMEYLADVVSSQAFKPWELERNIQRLKVDLSQLPPATQALELLHKAAFRSGLGNSLYCAPYRVGSHNTAALQQFVSQNFTSARSAMVGLGVGHEKMVKYSDLLNMESGAGPSTVVSKYCGGELRHETGGGLAYVALAANCAGAVSVAECVAAMLLQRVLGMGSHIKYSSGQGKLVLAAGSESASVSAIGQMYSDSGLLGAMVVAEAGAAGKVVESVAAALRGASVTDEEVEAAKKNMLADVYSELESPLSQVENIGSQILLSGAVMPAEKVPELIAGLTTADVQAAAKRLSNASLSMGAVGNLSTVPYLDTL